MKRRWNHLDKFRTQKAPYTSPEGATYGAFELWHDAIVLRIIATDGRHEEGDTGWEHVSVHAYDPFFKKQKIPKWEAMCFVKDLFWEEGECVVQFHPAKEDYVNTHACVLHLWRATKEPFPMPPKICV